MAGTQRLAGRKRSTTAQRAITDAALATLHEDGFHALTIEGVAARAGVGKATVYRWWPSKAALAIEALAGQLGEPLRPTGETEADVRRVVEASFQMVGGVVGELLIADLRHDPDAGRQLEDMLGPYRAALGGILLSVAGRGDLPYDVDVGKVLDLVSGVALVRRVMNRSVDDQLIEELTTLVLTGPMPRTSATGK